jgi:hypothetical protein
VNKRQFSVMLQQKAAKSRKVKNFAEKAKAVLREEYAPHRRTGQLDASVQIIDAVNSDGINVPFVAVTHPAAKWIDRGHWAGKGENIVWVDGLHGVARAAKRLRRGHVRG